MASKTQGGTRAAPALSAGILFALVATQAMAESPACESVMTPYEAVYVSSYRGLRLQGRRTLSQQGDGVFVLAHTASGLGSSVSEQSVFRLHADRIRGESYDMTRSILGIKRERHIRFDWDSGKVRVTGSNEVELPLDDELLDPLSYQLAMRCDFAQGKTGGSYPVVTRKRVKRYDFRVTGTEPLETNIGVLKTLVAERDTQGKRSTKVWVAPDLNFLLVRLEQTESKDDLSLVLEIERVAFD
jgi:hypothetical protein